MYRKLTALAAAALLLAACGKDEAPKQALECAAPSVTQDIKIQIEDTLRQEARAFVRNDARQFVDADKIIAAASSLDIVLDNPREVNEDNQTLCGAELQIRMPSEILKAADAASPLIYGSTPLKDLIEQKILGSAATFNGDTFTASIRYTPDSRGKAGLADNTVSMTAKILSVALLPYGVKDTLLVDGKSVSRAEALKILQSKGYEEPPEVSPEDILEHNAAASVEGVPQAEGLETEILHPDADETPSFSQNDLDNARGQNRQAENEITGIWDGMERGVQERMQGEQRDWIRSKNQNCQQAAAQADNPAQAEYLKLQCDTRMTRERAQYLRGYSIN